MQAPRAAQDDFAACIRKIDRFPHHEFRFLVGGFDPKQIRALCVRWVDRLDRGTTERSHGS
ncbi:MAG: hypothetical protein PF508_19605, partial [Spirochaeta sp.]|nr:hypothetical protein [Spirochaeta sp.]